MKIRLSLTIIMLLFAVTVAMYARTAYFPFAVVDDALYVFSNDRVTSGLSSASLKWAFTTFHASNWHPVTWLSLMVDSQLFGLNPIGYHVVNVLLHALNTSLLFLLLYIMTGAALRSVFVALCFALHPLHVESVAWITERKDVLSFFFFMLTLLCYQRYVKLSRYFWYLSSLAAFALGLMAKPMLVTTPLLLLLVDYWPLGRFGFLANATQPVGINNSKRLLIEKAPFFLFAAISSCLTIIAQHDTISNLAHLSLSDRIGNALWSTLTYMRKTVLPIDLAMFYPYRQVSYEKLAFAAILLFILSFLILGYARRFPYLVTGWFWFLISLLPVIGLVQVGAQAMADRYTYIPLVGLFIIVSWGGAEICDKHPASRTLLRLTAVVAVLILALVTWTQSGYWSDNIKLSEHAIAVTDNNYFAHFCLGRTYEKQGQWDLATTHYLEALRINPDSAESHINLGALLDNQGKVSGAINHFTQAISLTPRSADAHYGLGNTYAKTGRLEESINEYRAAIMIEPGNIRYHNNIGTALAQSGKLDEAIQHFSIVLRLSPDDTRARSNLDLATQQIRQLADERKSR